MIRSFRLRLTLLSALLSGLVLTAFALSAWWLIRGEKMDRLDNDVRSQAERESQRTRDASGWQRAETTMVSEVGIRNNRDLLLLVQDGVGNILYRSANWPAGLDAAHFPWPTQPVRRGAGPNPRQPAVDSASDPIGNGRLPLDPETAAPGPPPASRAVSFGANGRQWRIGLASTSNSRIAVAVDGASIQSDMRGILSAFLIALPLCLILIGVGAWAISSRTLRPLQKLTTAARRVTAEGLDQRISPQGEDREFVELIHVFNGMLERLERSFKQAYRFSADAAHELKTPLAILQGQIERAIHEAEDGSNRTGGVDQHPRRG